MGQYSIKSVDGLIVGAQDDNLMTKFSPKSCFIGDYLLRYAAMMVCSLTDLLKINPICRQFPRVFGITVKDPTRL